MGRANSSDAAAQEGGESDTGGRTMSVSKGVGIPVKLLHEAEGHIVTVELKTGETFRGTLKNSEDNWNCQLENVTATARDHPRGLWRSWERSRQGQGKRGILSA